MSVDAQVVLRRLDAMSELLTHLDHLGITSTEALGDLGTRLQVERILTQVVNLAGEINAHLATSLLGRAPGDFRQGFDLAANADVITTALAQELKPSVGLRNILTHEYVDVDLEIVLRSIPRALSSFSSYVRSVARFLQS